MLYYLHVLMASAVGASRLGAPPTMAFYPVVTNKASSPVKNALNKRSGALTVSVEYSPVAGNDHGVAPIDAGEFQGEGRRTVALTAEERLQKISGALRGGREGSLASSIWTADLDSVRMIAEEQATAKGDFPGPCPVVFCGQSAHAEAAVAAGANGVLLCADAIEQGKGLDAEVVWSVSSADEVAAIVGDDGAPEDAFLVDASADDAAAIVHALPKGAVAVATVDAMQPDDAEVAAARAFTAMGCKSVVVRDACVGDVEDLPYATFAIKALTSKRSSAFAIDGHTGAVNGHFGGARAAAASPEGGWQRRQ